MKLPTKVASAVVSIGLAGTAALAIFGTGSAAAHVPAVVHLTAIPAASGQASPPTGPASSSTAVPSGPVVDSAGAEAPESGAEATTEPAGETQPPGGGHADAPGTVDHQFDGAE